jgi:hypothetical protein
LKEITKEYLQEFVKKRNINLKSSQTKLSILIIKRIVKKMQFGIEFSDIKVVDDLIIDGHHRFIASQILEKQLNNIPYNKTSATKIVEWKSVNFENIDWDNADDIRKYNERDALIHGVSIEEIEKIIN